jgi:hypothetical protein
MSPRLGTSAGSHGAAAVSYARQGNVTGEARGRCLAFHELSPAEFRARDGRQPVVETFLAFLVAAIVDGVMNTELARLMALANAGRRLGQHVER